MSPYTTVHEDRLRAQIDLQRAIARAEASVVEMQRGLEVLDSHIHAARASLVPAGA